MDSGASTIIFLLLVAIGLFAYMAPGLVAHHRKHRNAQAITVLHVLAGWTFLGWVGALVWAFTANRQNA